MSISLKSMISSLEALDDDELEELKDAVRDELRTREDEDADDIDEEEEDDE